MEHMLTDNKNRVETDAAALSEEETKQYLTPFAFKIDKSLFGLPLASPTKRGIALLIDLGLVALLSDISGDILALVIVITLYYLGNKKRARQRGKIKGYKRRAIMRFFAAMMVFVILLDTLPPFFGYFDSNDTTAQVSTMSENISLNEPMSVDEAIALANTMDELGLANDVDFSEVIENDDKGSPVITSDTPEKSNKPVYSLIEWVKGIINDLGLGFGWATFYFTAFIALGKGQTIGKRILGIKVLQLDGSPLSVWDSFGRYGGYGAGLATGLLGFIQIYWDPNKQAIHDKISATVVIDVRKARLIQSEQAGTK